jgi:hypothetical protein
MHMSCKLVCMWSLLVASTLRLSKGLPARTRASPTHILVPHSRGMQGLRDTLGAALAEVGACPGGEPGPHAQAERFAEGLAEAADAAVGSREACERVVQLAREAFLDAAGSDDLLECAMMTVTRPLGRCADAADSAVAAATLRAVLERMAERCNARDAVVELLAALDDGSRCATVMRAHHLQPRTMGGRNWQILVTTTQLLVQVNRMYGEWLSWCATWMVGWLGAPCGALAIALPD